MPIKSYQRPLAPPGDEPYCRVLWKGPSSYAQITLGPPVGAGDPIVASQFGVTILTGVDIEGGYGADFTLMPIRITDAKWTFKWVALRTGTIGGQSQTVGTEAAAATDLSSQVFSIAVNTLAG